MTADDLRFILIIVGLCVGFGGIFVILLPIILIKAMLGSAATTIAASKSNEDTQ